MRSSDPKTGIFGGLLVRRRFINNDVFESAIKHRASLYSRTYLKPSSPSYGWMTP
jgi:hypothetical protein